MNIPSTESNCILSLSLPVVIYTRLPGQSEQDWREFDRGPGYIKKPAGMDVGMRIKSIDDLMLVTLVEEIVNCHPLIMLNLSENRNISDDGIARLVHLKDLTQLNLSSCSITNQGLIYLAELPHLMDLNLSYCNRLTDLGMKYIKKLTGLTYLDLQGCRKITQAGFAKIQRRGLTVHK